MEIRYQRVMDMVKSMSDLDPRFCTAVAKVESDCIPFSVDYPVVRFERSVFIRYIKRTRVDLLDKAVSLMGTSFETYDKARKIDEESAILSTSFGLYQIMGFNHRPVGYDTPKEFEQAMQIEENQIKAFFAFVRVNKLEDAITNKDFKTFAFKYNGPNYMQYRYDAKLQEAYKLLV